MVIRTGHGKEKLKGNVGILCTFPIEVLVFSCERNFT